MNSPFEGCIRSDGRARSYPVGRTPEMTNAQRMPAVFVGHGTPFNALLDNRFTQSGRELGRQLPRLKAILAFSARCYIGATAAAGRPWPPTVHVFYGFPREIYE